MEIRTLEISGIYSALKALHLPFKGDMKSCLLGTTLPSVELDRFGNAHGVDFPEYYIQLSNDDLTLLKALIRKGDEHAKVVRGINVWVEIKAPIYFWWDSETYIIGHQRLCSESTMNDECRGLTGNDLQKAKGLISFGREITKIDMFSYQTVSRICAQRKTHRLPEFHQLIDWARTLPLANELKYESF